jgi:prepilin-type processing-associated H-X9-DG protein
MINCISSNQKPGSPPNINLNETALKLLGQRGKPTDFIFMLPSSTAANKCLQRWVDRAKIEKKITWHCARHSFGTNILFYDGDILSTSKLLGHSSLTYTQRYVRVVEQMKQDAVNKLPTIEVF